MSTKKKTKGGDLDSRIVAVIELGTTSVRMAIASIDSHGAISQLDSLQQAVSLGRETFTEGSIARETTEECVRVLRSFRKVLDEYHITDHRNIMAVATSAVREASNRAAVLDRIFIATGIRVEIAESAEVNRYTYLAVRPLLESHPNLTDGSTLVVEVGGGSTEALLMHDGEVSEAHTYRLGSLRLRKLLEEERAPASRMGRMMKVHVDSAVRLIMESAVDAKSLSILALGGEMRYACECLLDDWDMKKTVRLRVSDLARLTKEIMDLSIDDLVKQRRISYQEADTLGPALLIYTRLAQELKQRYIHVGSASLRAGMLAEIGSHGVWTAEFTKQILRSAAMVGEKYDFDQDHAENVASLSLQLFDALHDEHHLDSRHRVILNTAALLHDVGLYVSDRAHHKHSLYLIAHSDIFGLSARDLMLTALTARYHRRALPKPSHENYSALDMDQRVAVSKMAAILRVADAMSRRRPPHIHKLDVRCESGRMVVTVAQRGDLSLERHALQMKRQMFEQTYGMKVELRQARVRRSDGKA